MDRVDAAFKASWTRWQQLEMGTVYDAPDAPRAAALERPLNEAHARRRAGTLDGAAFVRWACKEAPWLARQLGDEPEPAEIALRAARSSGVADNCDEKPQYVDAPHKIAAAIAKRIVNGDRQNKHAVACSDMPAHAARQRQEQP